MDYFNTATGARYHMPNIIIEKKMSFPVDWFNSNPGTKPKFSLPKIESYDIGSARSAAYSFLSGDKVSINSVLYYLKVVFQRMEETLKEPWISYNVTIGTDVVTPLSLITVEEFDWNAETKLQNPVTFGDDADLYLLLVIFGVYRYSITHKGHQSTIKNNLKKLALAASGNYAVWVDPSLMMPNGILLKENESFVALAAAFDMFCVKFPKNKYAKARFGTVNTRYSGCATLDNLKYFKDLLNGDSAMDWVFTDSAGDELERIFNKNDEREKEDSYFPYASGFGIVLKNPYSVSSCPNFYRLVHAYGCLLHKERSFNAPYVEGGCPINIAVNACLAYIAKRQSVSTSGEKEVNENRAQPNSATEWLIHFRYNQKNKFTDEQKHEIELSIKSMPEMRENTVGQWVKRSLLVFLQ